MKHNFLFASVALLMASVTLALLIILSNVLNHHPQVLYP